MVAFHRLRRGAELFLERAGECFMRRIAGIEREFENIGRVAGKLARGLAEPAAAHIAHDRLARRCAERMRKMKRRYIARLGDSAEREIAVQISLDDPDGLGCELHVKLPVSDARG